ncbi:unnamed protein product, partial [Mesorhabditis spiculigera]
MLDDFSTWNTLLITLIGLGICPFQIRRMLVDCQDLNTITAWFYPGFVNLFIPKAGLVLIINLMGKAGIVNASLQFPTRKLANQSHW